MHSSGRAEFERRFILRIHRVCAVCGEVRQLGSNRSISSSNTSLAASFILIVNAAPHEVFAIRFRTLGDFTKHEANLGCVCSKCGRKVVVYRLVLARWCYLKRKNMAVECLPEYLRCSACGSRPNRIAPTSLPSSFPGYGRDERQWKHIERKLRG
jgi:hypothetical protein